MILEVQLASRAVVALEKLAEAQTKIAIEAKRRNDGREETETALFQLIDHLLTEFNK